MTVYLSRLGFWLWYLLPANPILVRVVTVASRRPRHLWLRIGYLGVLVFVVLISLLPSLGGGGDSLAEMAQRSSQTFKYAAIAQLALMCFLAPVFTASAITQERDAETFNILLATPLSSAQIVFGSLMSRLYFVIMLLVAGIPIFVTTMLYGGVTASQVFKSFALSGATAILTGAVAIFIAMLGVGTRRTIFSFYLVIGLYLLCLYLLAAFWSRTWVDGSPPNVNGQRMSWLTPLHPFLSLDVALNRLHAPPYERLADRPKLVRYALAYPSAVYVAWTLSLSLVLTSLSVLFVRRGAKTGEITWPRSLVQRLTRRTGDALTRTPRSVWSNPVAWREAKTKASGGRVLRYTIVAAGFLGPAILFVYSLSDSLSPSAIAEWLSGFVIVQFALALLVATNTAATSVTKEKESLAMDLLLTTPLTSKYILWGKLRGLVSFTLPLLAGPMLALLVFGAYGLLTGGAQAVIGIETALELSTLLLVYTGCACLIGLWRSLHSKTNVAAVMYSLAVLILLGGLASLLGFSLVGAFGGEFGAFLAPFTPFTAIWYLLFPGALFPTPAEFARGAAAARTAALLGTMIAAALYAFIIWHLYSGLVRTFDMTLRKQSST